MFFLLAETSGITEYSAGAVALMLLAALLWFVRHVVTIMIPNVIAESSKTATSIAELGRLTAVNLTAELVFARTQYFESIKEERVLRHAERNIMNTSNLAILTAIQANTAETAKLAQEVRSISMGNQAKRKEGSL